MQMRFYSYGTTGCIDLSNCITDDITTYNNDNMWMKSAFCDSNDFPLFLTFFINIHEHSNYANRIICIFDHGIKGMCPSFNLVLFLEVYMY